MRIQSYCPVCDVFKDRAPISAPILQTRNLSEAFNAGNVNSAFDPIDSYLRLRMKLDHCSDCAGENCTLELHEIYCPNPFIIFSTDGDAKPYNFPTKLSFGAKTYTFIGSNRLVNGNHWVGIFRYPDTGVVYNFDSIGSRATETPACQNYFSPMVKYYYYIEHTD